MSDYKDRAIEEQTELAIKIEKLNKFISTKEFARFDTLEKYDLLSQLSAMKAYNKSLKSRISRF